VRRAAHQHDGFNGEGKGADMDLRHISYDARSFADLVITERLVAEAYLACRRGAF
jgi:hypothetical protein